MSKNPLVDKYIEFAIRKHITKVRPDYPQSFIERVVSASMKDYGVEKSTLIDAIVLATEDNIKLESALAAEREKTRWVSVGERLPEDNQEVYAREFSGVITHFKYSSKLVEIFRRHYTHWQPPIEPPKEGEE